MTDAELNALVAKAKGWTKGDIAPRGCGECLVWLDGHHIVMRLADEYNPQGSIADAWPLVEELAKAGWIWQIHSRNPFMSDQDQVPCVTFMKMLGGYIVGNGKAEDENVKRAICLAYLKAKGVEVPE